MEGNNWAPPTPVPAAPNPKGPWWRRRWVLISAGAVAALVAVGLVAPKDGVSSVHTADTSPAAAATQGPTTVAPTTSTTLISEAATTAAPTTDVPTTVAPTPPSTTVSPPPRSTEPPATTVAPAAVQPTSVVTQVIDGDTIVIDTGEHIRFIGIDTPEGGHCGYSEATTNMRNMVHGKAVVLTPGARDDVDVYGRLLRYVDLPDGTDTGLAQIKAGLAVARYDSRDGYGHHPRQEQYVAADTGVAAPCVFGTGATGTTAAGPVTPRGRVAPNSDGSCPPEAPIKGNADSGIYHRPGQQAYNRTKAEDCFATPSDAEAAGYRAAKR